MKKIMLTAIVAVLALSLCGCYDSVTISDVGFVTAIGIDEGSYGQYRFTFQFVKPEELAAKGGGGGDSGKSDKENVSKNKALVNLTINAPTVFDALEAINLSLAKSPDLKHAKLILISDKIAKRGLEDELTSFMSSNDFQSNLYVAICKDSCEKYLANINSPLQQNPTRYYDAVFNASLSPYLPGIYLKDFYIAANSDCIDATLPLVGVKEMKSSKEVAAPFDKNNGHFSATAGEGIAFTETDSEAAGMAIFSDSKLTDTVNGGDALKYALIRGTFKQAYYTLPQPEDPASDTRKFFTVSLSQNRKPSYEVDLSGEKPLIFVNLFLEGSFITLPSELNLQSDENGAYEYYADSVKHDLADICLKILEKTRDDNADIFGFGKKVKMQCLTLDEWDSVDWRNLYRESEFSVNIKLEMERGSRLTSYTSNNKQSTSKEGVQAE